MPVSVSFGHWLCAICFWSLFLTAALSNDAKKEDIRPASRAELSKGSCYSMCDSRYSSPKTDPWFACHRGCRLLSLLGQMANGKSRKDVKHSCLSACTEAYNVTSQEKACHAGCNEHQQLKAKKKKLPAGGPANRISAHVLPVVPKPNPPNIKFFWSKSVVDEQDVDSSSEEKTHVPDFLSSFRNNPFDTLSSIWRSSLIPASFRITKSSATYISDESLPSPAATNDQPKLKTTSPGTFVPDSVREQEASTPIPETRDAVEAEVVGTPVIIGSHLFIRRPSDTEKNDTILVRVDGSTGRLDILIFFIGLSFFVAFLILFRAAMFEKDYFPLTTSDPSFLKRDEAAAQGLVSVGEDDLDSLDDLLDIGFRSRLHLSGPQPPTYEEAQQDVNAKSGRPLLVSLQVSTPSDTVC